jgi:biotin transporter BioY
VYNSIGSSTTFLLVGIFVGFVLSKTQKPNKIIIFLAGIGTGMVVLYISAAMAVNGSLYALQHSYYTWKPFISDIFRSALALFCFFVCFAVIFRKPKKEEA